MRTQLHVLSGNPVGMYPTQMSVLMRHGRELITEALRYYPADFVEQLVRAYALRGISESARLGNPAVVTAVGAAVGSVVAGIGALVSGARKGKAAQAAVRAQAAVAKQQAQLQAESQAAMRNLVLVIGLAVSGILLIGTFRRRKG